ncbi:MAG: thioredoxin-dependent thiol peroxidase [Firmicutes bacterium HGW-Firmicutes-7]|nr:MAG: thioredoxin-dependent thiol peroxidase [Firmicutes bacterium HGW-Firmicutes-7]
MPELLTVGTKAPDFTLINGQGSTVSLKDFLGKKVIIYFYPKDNTPGCTSQACGFRDSYGDFQSSNTIVIGISKDNVKSHSNFAAKYELPFVLLCDEEGKVCEQFGVWKIKKNYGKEYMGIVRSTFVINEEGIIEKVFPNVKVDGHVEKVLDYINGK